MLRQKIAHILLTGRPTKCSQILQAVIVSNINYFFILFKQCAEVKAILHQSFKSD